MSAELLAAIGGLVTGLVGILISFQTAKNAARQSEFEILRQSLALLQQENTRLRDRVTCLEKENDELRKEIDQLRSGSKRARKTDQEGQ